MFFSVDVPSWFLSANISLSTVNVLWSYPCYGLHYDVTWTEISFTNREGFRPLLLPDVHEARSLISNSR